MKYKIFISSVQKEFEAERAALREYLRADPMLRRFFEPFVFEDKAAADQSAVALYMNEIGRCEVYIGIFGNQYGLKMRMVFRPRIRSLMKQPGAENIV